MTTMRETWAHALVEIAARSPRTVVLDADLATSTRSDIFADVYPDRFFQMGIAEQHLMGAAAGMAQMGLTPWISSFGVFMTHRALDPMRMLVAQCRSNVKIVGSYTGLCFGKAGKTHHDHADLTILRAMPNLVVLAPGDNAECAQMTRWANDYQGPVYLRLIREQPSDLPTSAGEPFRPGQVRTFREGSALALISTGSQTGRILQAADSLASAGVLARVVHVPWIKPLDEAGLIHACRGVDTIVTVEDQSIHGGLGGMVAEVIAASSCTARVHRIGLNDTWVGSGSNEYLLDHHGLSAAAVTRAVCERLGIAADVAAGVKPQ